MLKDAVPRSGSASVSQLQVFAVEELAKRPSRTPDYEAENRAIASLCRLMADTPDALFQRLVETVRDLCGADSAAVSILDPERPGVFRWHAIAGPLSKRAGEEVSHDASLCGLFLDHDAPLLFTDPMRTFTFGSAIDPPIVETLVAPFQVGGKLIGMIWAIAHSAARKFEGEDQRILTNLSRIAAAAHQTNVAMQAAQITRADLERQGNERTAERRRAEGQLRLALDASSAGTWVWDPVTNQSDWDERYHAMYGFAPSEPRTFESWIGLIHPEDRPKVITRLDEISRTPGCDEWNLEFRVILPDQKIAWMHGLGRALRNSSGQLVFMAGINLDVTERKRTEEALRRTEENLRGFFDNVVVGTAQVDSEGRYIRVNNRFCQIAGYTREELLGGMRVSDVNHPEDREADAERVGSFLRGETQSYEAEKRYRRKDGSTVWVHVAASIVHDDSGRFLCTAAIVKDITKRKQALEALKLGEERLRAFLENSATIAWLKDEHGRHVFLSRNYEQRLGVRLKDWYGKTDFEVWPREIAEVFRRNDDNVLAAGADIEVIEHTVSADGAKTYWLNHKFIVQDAAGNRFVGGLGVDITARVENEQALKQLNATLEKTVAERTRDVVEREERLQAILNAAVDSIITVDRQGIIQAVNPATEALSGYPAAELIGQHVGILMATSDEWEQSDFAKTCLRTGANNPQCIGREIVGRRKDDSNFPAEMSVSEIPNLELFTCIIRDISLRKDLEREVVEIASMEQRRIGQDLHDSVGQDLTALELLMGDLADASKTDQPGGVDIVSRMTEGLRRCKTELRAVLRGLLPVSVDALGLMAALSDLAERTRQGGKTSCTFDCPNPVAFPDNLTATHFYLIAQEAVHNAIKHARPRNIRISVSQDATHDLILCVQDDGIGILESNGREKGAEGLGLRIIRSRAAIIGATLTIERSRLHGTLVQCTLPRMNRAKKQDQEKVAGADRR